MIFARHLIAILALCLALMPAAQAMGLHGERACVHQALEDAAGGSMDAAQVAEDRAGDCVSPMVILAEPAPDGGNRFALALRAAPHAPWRSASLEGWKRPPRLVHATG